MRSFLFLFLAFLTIPCYGFDAFPVGVTNMSISLSDDKPSYPSDWPNGAYQLPNRNIYVSALNGNAEVNRTVILFGLLGAGSYISSLATHSKQMIDGPENDITFDLNTMTTECLKKEIELFKNTIQLNLIPPYARSTIKITPFLIFSFVDGQKSRIWIEIKAEVKSTNLQNRWSCHYLCSLGTPRPIHGRDSWTSDGGKTLTTYVRSNIENDLWAMLMDFQGKLRDGIKPKKKINGRWIFYNETSEVDTRVLIENKDMDIVETQVGDDAYYAGINILSKDFNEPLLNN